MMREDVSETERAEQLHTLGVLGVIVLWLPIFFWMAHLGSMAALVSGIAGLSSAWVTASGTAATTGSSGISIGGSGVSISFTLLAGSTGFTGLTRWTFVNSGAMSTIVKDSGSVGQLICSPSLM